MPSIIISRGRRGEDDDGAGATPPGGAGSELGARTRGAARIGASSPTRRVRARGARRGVAVEEPGVEAVEAVHARAAATVPRRPRGRASVARGVRLVVAGPVEEVPTGRLALAGHPRRARARRRLRTEARDREGRPDRVVVTGRGRGDGELEISAADLT